MQKPKRTKVIWKAYSFDFGHTFFQNSHSLILQHLHRFLENSFESVDRFEYIRRNVWLNLKN